jgi:hypothetical protein
MSAVGVSADHHLVDESRYWYLVELARYFWDNDPIYSSAIQRIADNVIGCGFHVDPTTGVEAIDDYLYEDWRKFSKANSSDSSQEHGLHKRAYIEFCSVLNDGDIFNVPRSSGQIQTLESHRCTSSRGTAKDVVLGVEQNDEGVRTRYWFTKTDRTIGYSPKYSEIEQIEARDRNGNKRVWHYYLPKRMSQRRGVPVIAPIAEFVQMHNDIQYAKLFQQQAVSSVALFHELPFEAFQQMDPDERSIATGMLEASASGERFQWNPRAGMDYWARFPGEKLTAFSGNVPNPEYFQHVTMILGIIAVNLGIPLAVLMMDPSNTNFSGWRGAVDQARRGWERLQESFGVPWYSDKWTWRIRKLAAEDKQFQAILREGDVNPADVLRDPNHFVFSHNVHPPRWKYIQPVEDITARAAELGAGLISPRQDAAAYGRDYYEVIDQTIEDRDYALRKAADAYMAFKSSYPDLEQSPTWMHWWSPLMPENIRFNVSTSHSESESKSETKTDQPSTGGMKESKS